MITVNGIQYLTPVTNKTSNESIEAFQALSTEAYLILLPMITILVLAISYILPFIKANMDKQVARKNFSVALRFMGSLNGLLHVCFVLFFTWIYGRAWVDCGVVDWDGIYDNFDDQASIGLGVCVAYLVYVYKIFFLVVVPHLVIAYLVSDAWATTVQIDKVTEEFLRTLYLELKEKIKQSVEICKEDGFRAMWERRKEEEDDTRDGYIAPPPSPVFGRIR